MKIRFIRKILFVLLLIAFLFGFLTLTSPSEISLLALFVPFILFYAVMYLILDGFASIFMKNVKVEYRRWVVAAIALLPVAFMLTLSAGQTDPTDVLLFVALTALLIFYFSRTNFLK